MHLGRRAENAGSTGLQCANVSWTEVIVCMHAALALVGESKTTRDVYLTVVYSTELIGGRCEH
jgi:hypothetical protein